MYSQTLNLIKLAIFILLSTVFIQKGNSIPSNGNESTSESNADADANVKVVKSLKIFNIKGKGLHFGKIITPSPPHTKGKGYVTVFPDGNYALDDVIMYDDSPLQSAKFKVTGPNEADYEINIAPKGKGNGNNFRMEHINNQPGGQNQIEVDLFTHNAVGKLNNGKEKFQVGARAHINHNNVPGKYSGKFEVLVTLK